MKIYDLIIIGGGQAGLSIAYFLKRKEIDYLVLDENSKAGGAWLKTWDSLKLFSPRQYSSLSGWQMPKTDAEYPTKDEFIDYLEAYENRYHFPVQRNTTVVDVTKENNRFKITTESTILYCRALVSATGTANNPFIPEYPNTDKFKGKQIHSVDYRNPDQMKDKKVLVVGGGNSGAQILAEVAKYATTKWVTLKTPNFLPEHIDGRYLFQQATEKYLQKNTEKKASAKVSLSDIVQVESVKDGLKRNVYKDYRPFKSFYSDGVIWENNTKEAFDIVIWCTGFKPHLKHLSSLAIFDNGKIKTTGTRAKKTDGLWLVGYGNWTGYASATIYGVGKTAKQTVKEIESYLG
ncbi:MAG: ArsO family NAD(P)H-dependent flavin-containing monooxygenase [Bacteroidota bacterium]